MSVSGLRDEFVKERERQTLTSTKGVGEPRWTMGEVCEGSNSDGL